MELDIIIEGLLFYKATPQNKKKVQELLGVPEQEFNQALAKLSQRLERGATRLVETNLTISLATSTDMSELIERVRTAELSANIGKAGSETLAIILYREPISRAEIDKIRGVNSAFILRNLLSRGLICRQNSKGGFHYSITSDLLQHLGVTSKHDLPQYAHVMDALDSFTNQPS